MPKDATKNVDRYKVRGGHLNEYDFEHDKTAQRTHDTAQRTRDTAARKQNAGNRQQNAANRNQNSAERKQQATGNAPRTALPTKAPKKK